LATTSISGNPITAHRMYVVSKVVCNASRR
jgi:hypothetical protein